MNLTYVLFFIFAMAFGAFLTILNSKTYQGKKSKFSASTAIKTTVSFSIFSHSAALIFGTIITLSLFSLLYFKVPVLYSLPILLTELGMFIFAMSKTLNQTVKTLPVSPLVNEILLLITIPIVGYILFNFIQVILVVFPK